MTELARWFSKHFNCQTICDGSCHGENKSYQGYSLIWGHDKAYLVEDFGRKFMNEGGACVKILKLIVINNQKNINLFEKAINYQKKQFKKLILNYNFPMQKTIKFYSVNNDYGEFSNFSLYPVKIKGKLYPTSEHYFQAMKFDSLKDQKEIRTTKSPMLAAQKGRDRKRKLKRNWESIKDNVMREAVFNKFSQHDILKVLLINTGTAKIIEHTENDSYWGDGGDGKGKNKLGQILMEVREKLKE
jgi:ribA/ribD-fused uncharacterized protein